MKTMMRSRFAPRIVAAVAGLLLMNASVSHAANMTIVGDDAKTPWGYDAAHALFVQGGGLGGGSAADQSSGNNADGVASTSTGQQKSVVFNYGYNGTTWDRARVGAGGAWLTIINQALPAGPNIIGKVGIDQTTHGTTDKTAADLYVGGNANASGNPAFVQATDDQRFSLTTSTTGPLLGTGADPTLGWIPTKGYGSISVLMSAAGAIYVFEETNDVTATTGNAIAATPSTSAGNASDVTGGTTVASFDVPVRSSYFRIRTGANGATSALVSLRSAPYVPRSTYVGNPQTSPLFASEAGGTYGSTQVAVTTTAVQVCAARTARRAATITQTAGTPTDVFLGPSGVSTTSGALLVGTKGASKTINTTAAIYAIAGTAGATVSCEEVYN